MSLFSKLLPLKFKKKQNSAVDLDTANSPDDSNNNSENSPTGDNVFTLSSKKDKDKKKGMGRKGASGSGIKNGSRLSVKLLIIPIIVILLLLIYFLFGDTIKNKIYGKKNIDNSRVNSYQPPPVDLDNIMLPEKEEDNHVNVTSDDIINDFATAKPYDYLSTLSYSDFSDLSNNNRANVDNLSLSTPSGPSSISIPNSQKGYSSEKISKYDDDKESAVKFTETISAEQTKKTNSNKATNSEHKTTSKVNKYSPYDVNNMVLSGEKALYNGKINEALDMFTKAYELSPSAQLSYHIIDLYIKSRQFDNASNLLIKSDMAEDLKLQLLQDMYVVGATTEAMNIVNTLIKNDINGDYYYFRGFLYDELGDIDNAILDYKAAMLQSNYNSYYTYAYARILDIQKNYKEAIEYYRFAASNTDDREVRLNALKRLIVLESM